MIVFDASAAIELLLRSDAELRILRLLEDGGEAAAPEVFDVEVLSALRRLEAAGTATTHRADAAAETLGRLPIQRCPHGTLVPRIWQLRNHINPYDAAYVALAEALEAELVTSDRRLARTHGHHARIVLYPG